MRFQTEVDSRWEAFSLNLPSGAPADSVFLDIASTWGLVYCPEEHTWGAQKYCSSPVGFVCRRRAVGLSVQSVRPPGWPGTGGTEDGGDSGCWGWGPVIGQQPSESRSDISEGRSNIVKFFKNMLQNRIFHIKFITLCHKSLNFITLNSEIIYFATKQKQFVV